MALHKPLFPWQSYFCSSSYFDAAVAADAAGALRCFGGCCAGCAGCAAAGADAAVADAAAALELAAWTAVARQKEAVNVANRVVNSLNM